MVQTSKQSRAPKQKLSFEKAIKAPNTKMVKLIDTLKSKLTTADNSIIPNVNISQNMTNGVTPNIPSVNLNQTLTDPLKNNVHDLVNLNEETSSKTTDILDPNSQNSKNNTIALQKMVKT